MASGTWSRWTHTRQAQHDSLYFVVPSGLYRWENEQASKIRRVGPVLFFTKYSAAERLGRDVHNRMECWRTGSTGPSSLQIRADALSLAMSVRGAFAHATRRRIPMKQGSSPRVLCDAGTAVLNGQATQPCELRRLVGGPVLCALRQNWILYLAVMSVRILARPAVRPPMICEASLIDADFCSATACARCRVALSWAAPLPE